MPKPNILLIYNLIPEDQKFYSVPVDHHLVQIIHDVNGIFINNDDLTESQEKAWGILNAALTLRKYDGNEELIPFEISMDKLNQPFSGVSNVNFLL